MTIMEARITQIHFDRDEQPYRAVIRTRLGIVEVQWRDVAGDRCWFTNGKLEAKKMAAAAIERLNRMVSRLQ